MQVARVTHALALCDAEYYVIGTAVNTGTGVILIATVKETANREEFQAQQRADLLGLYCALCEIGRAVLGVFDEVRVGRLAILEKHMADLFKRCGTKRSKGAVRGWPHSVPVMLPPGRHANSGREFCRLCPASLAPRWSVYCHSHL